MSSVYSDLKCTVQCTVSHSDQDTRENLTSVFISQFISWSRAVKKKEMKMGTGLEHWKNIPSMV